MKNTVFFWYLSFVILLPQNIYAENLVFSGVEYPPFFISPPSSKDSIQNDRGILIDLLMLFSKEHPEYQIIYKQHPAARANKYLAKGEGIDISFDSPIFVEKNLLNHYDFTETVAQTKDVVITKKDNPFTYEEPEDLYGMRIAVIRGYEYGEFDELEKTKKIQYHVVNTHRQTLQLLKIGRVDASFGNIHVSPYIMKLNKLDISDYKFSDKSIFQFELSLMVNKKTDLLLPLNIFIKKIKNSGTLKTITEKYIK